MPIFLIDTTSTFRMKYAIEAKTLEHAYDELVMSEHNRDFEEISQRHLGEQIIDGREITYEELQKELERLKQNKEELCCHWMGDKLIHKVDYNEDTNSQ